MHDFAVGTNQFAVRGLSGNAPLTSVPPRLPHQRGDTALHAAVAGNHRGSMSWLLAGGAKVNCKNRVCAVLPTLRVVSDTAP